MARRFIPIENVTQQGLMEKNASTDKLWVQLKNVRRANGGWKKRPGTNRIDTGALPANDVGIPKLFWVYKHAESDSLSEVLRPNGTGTYDAWTNSEPSNWQGIDESTADDDTTYIETATKGNKSSFTLSDIAGTFNQITSLGITIKTKRDANVRQNVLVKVRISGTDYDFGTGQITVEKGTGWDVQTIDSSEDPSTNLPWTPTNVDALEVIIEKGEGFQIQTETKSLGTPPDNIVSGTRRYYDNVATSLTWNSTPQTTLSITYNENNSGDFRNLIYRLWDGSTARTGSLDTEGQRRVVDTDPITVTIGHPYAPLTGTGTVLELNAYRDGTIGSHTQTVTALSLTRTGKTADDTATTRITQVYVTVEGDGQNALKNSLLMLTSSAFIRAAEDLSSYTDVQGAAGAPTASDGAIWDGTEFLNKVYITNGTDDLFYYPSSGGNEFDELASQPVGRTIATYGGRVFLGDVTESSVRNNAKVRWSAIDDATNWTDSSSGGRFLDETPGKIVALRPLVEQGDNLIGVLAALKSLGIYHISATGSPSDPFVHKLMDGSSGCLSLGSVVGVSDANGRDSLVFLGHVGGSLQVMRWNGAFVEQFGDPVSPILEAEGDSVNLHKSIAVVDTFGNYILMFPTAGGGFLRQAVVYNFAHGVWTTWDLGDITALGRWVPNTGRPITVAGRPDGFAYKMDDDLSTDDTQFEDSSEIESIIETGDLPMIPGEPWRRGVLERIWMYYKADDTSTVWTIDGSSDGGATYQLDEDTDSEDLVLSGNEGLRLARSSMRIPGRKHRTRITSNLDDGKPTLLQLILEIEEGGTHPD